MNQNKVKITSNESIVFVNKCQLSFNEDMVSIIDF